MSLQSRPVWKSTTRIASSSQASTSSVAQILAAISVSPNKASISFKGVSLADGYRIAAKLEELQLQGRDLPVRCAYHREEGLVVITPMPSPLHECVLEWFHHVINQMQHAQFIPWMDWLRNISRGVGIGR